MLHVHRAERADGLVAALAALLADPAGDPFAPEIVAVPTRGMERWLTQRMSLSLGATPGRADGVCANIGFPSPRRLVGDAVATATGIDPATDPWLPERMAWPLLDVVDEHIGEPWLRSLATHLGAGAGSSAEAAQARRARRLGAVRHVADLFDRYALQRPAMLRGWARGEDRDGTGGDLADDVAWQAELWRRLAARIAEPDPAARRDDACARLRAEPGLAGLPARLSLFGLTRLPAGQLAVLHALAAARDVHLFVLHPSPALWERVAGTLAARPAPVARRAEDPTATLAGNRLLASWGDDARELQVVLDGVRDGAAVAGHHHPVRQGLGTLLARIQADVRGDSPPPGAPLPGEPDARAPLAPGDRSVQVHACHGRARQVEVVRDAILHLLAEDPTLEPRDIVVMCPDIETFAPLIQATFGAGEVFEDAGEPDPPAPAARPPDLRVRLADRSLRQTNPILGVVGRLLELADARLTASQVLDLVDREPLRRRFGLDDDDLARLEDWIAESGIRWGLDAAHREPFKLGALPAGTWRAGLDRLLVGVTMSEDEGRLFGGVLPLDDVDSRSIDLAGRFAELVARLRAALAALSAPQPIAAWAQAIAAAADALTATGARDAWQRLELGRLLGDVVSEATAAGAVHGASIALPDVRALLAERLAGRPTRANFRTGHLTVCTLHPMRSVPHRVVCLLGLDDGSFPRRTPRDGDDLILDDPHVGDRDSRSEDRQLLLDALLAATDHLVIAYTGNDERTNVARPPAVPVGELLDIVDRTVRIDDDDDAPGRPARDRVFVRHPLQPFDPRNFTAGALVEGRAWGFDGVTLAGARALVAERAPPPAFLAGPLPGEPAAVVELADLVRFVERPVRAFLRQRLGISVADYWEEIDDALPVALDGLQRWAVGQRLLEALLAGQSARDAVASEVARGTLPPGQLAGPIVDRVKPTVELIAAEVRALPAGAAEPGSVDVKVALAGGRVLSGTVPGVRGDLLLTVTFSRVTARQRLAAWVRLLALSAAHPLREFSAITIGRSSAERADLTIARIAPLAPAAALQQLALLVGLYDRGMREPLPIACRTSAAYARAAHDGADPVRAARREWESRWRYDGEDAEEDHELVFGGVRGLDDLLRETPRAGEDGDGWHEADATRLGRYARRLWAGLLACEEVVDR